MSTYSPRTARALDSYEARFAAGPTYPMHRCTGCHYEVESVDSHGTCDECAAARDAADEREAAEAAGAANDCDECGGYGVVRSQRMSPEADCDFETCPACSEADLAADEGFNGWCAARAEEAARHAAMAHDAFRIAVLVGQISYVRRRLRPIAYGRRAA